MDELPGWSLLDGAALLNEARQAMLDRDSALQKGDWAAFGEADARLTDAIDKLLALTEG